jgi:hypothetical protein
MGGWARFPDLVAQCAAGTLPLDTLEAAANELAIRRVILVEGVSDRAAIASLAAILGRNLENERIAVIPMGGAMSIGRFIRVLGPEGLDLVLSGLCDVGEESFFRRSLEAAGVGSNLTRERLEQLGFYVCDADLEDELIRALGAPTIEQAFADEGDLAAFRVFQNQPFQRTQTLDRQLHRFLGTIGGRKERYGGVLAARLEPPDIPRPLLLLLTFGDTGNA